MFFLCLLRYMNELVQVGVDVVLVVGGEVGVVGGDVCVLLV